MKRDKLIELAKKAGLGTEIHLSPRQGGASEEHIWGGEMQTKIMNNFAELIIRECSGFLKNTLDDHFAAEQLEEHFGVEE